MEVDDSRRAEVYKYYYDNFGNILKKETYKYGTLQSTYEYGYTDSNWRDLLTSYRGHTITYDAIGNPLSYYNGSSYTFTWTEGRKLASATLGSTNVSYNYENGNRVSKTVGEIVHNYYYISGNLVSETWDTKSLSFLYDESGVYGFIYNNGTTSDTYYYGKNLQGDVIDIYDDEMNLVAYYEYDAWGKLNAIYDEYGDTINARTNSTHPAVVNPIRYRSYYYDTETSLYFLNSRYYDAKIGRFINCDGLVSTGQGFIGFNMFAYCNNNPVMFVDPNGNCSGSIKHMRNVIAGIEICNVQHKAVDLFNACKQKEVVGEERVWPTGSEHTVNDYPNYPSGGPHNGTDISGKRGSEVYSVTAGTVENVVSYYPNDFRDWGTGTQSYGNYVDIRIDDYTIYRYAHLQQDICVEIGQELAAGDVIGFIGSTGYTVGPGDEPWPHLHFEVIVNECNRQNPDDYLP